MRKIETQMNTAIRDTKGWKCGNTEVAIVDEGLACVYLHGNKIAEVGEDFITLFDGGWQSNTTKSRLNALLEAFGLPGERVFQEKFQWKVTLTDGTSIPFFSGMRLN